RGRAKRPGARSRAPRPGAAQKGHAQLVEDSLEDPVLLGRPAALGLVLQHLEERDEVPRCGQVEGFAGFARGEGQAGLRRKGEQESGEIGAELGPWARLVDLLRRSRRLSRSRSRCILLRLGLVLAGVALRSEMTTIPDREGLLFLAHI